MGFRLRGQLMVLCLGLMGISLGIIAYFNIGVLRLSFIVDDEQRLRSVGVQTAERITHDLVDAYLSKALPSEQTDGDSVASFDLHSVPGLTYFELFDSDGEMLFRSGQSSDALARQSELLERVKDNPLPTHLFYDHGAKTQDLGYFPYYEKLSVLSESGSGPFSYEHFYPIFETVPDSSDMRLLGILHLSFQVDNTPQRMRLVTMGNILLALTFLSTTLMAIHLWTQHAIARPLEGLVVSMKQLETAPTGQELTSHNELANLSKTLQHLALERLKYQRELESLNRDLEAQVQEKTQEMKEFFSLVTHDLRIPLAAVQGYCDLLQRKPELLDERQLTFVKRIATANGHSLELVRNLLEAMKIEFGMLNPVTEEFSFEELAREVCDELNVDESLPPVVLKWADDESQKVNVEADRTRIKRVVTNLLSNAQKHADGTPSVELCWQRVPEDRVRIEVVDRGPGIPEEECKRVFERFVRAPDSLTNASGLGLGLYIVGKILESHGQTVELKSTVGVGTTFSFHLPAVTGT